MLYIDLFTSRCNMLSYALIRNGADSIKTLLNKNSICDVESESLLDELPQ